MAVPADHVVALGAGGFLIGLAAGVAIFVVVVVVTAVLMALLQAVLPGTDSGAEAVHRTETLPPPDDAEQPPAERAG